MRLLGACRLLLLRTFGFGEYGGADGEGAERGGSSLGLRGGRSRGSRR